MPSARQTKKQIQDTEKDVTSAILEYIPLDQELVDTFDQAPGRPTGTEKFDSRRKLQVIALLYTGASMQAVAHASGVSVQTINNHMRSDPQFKAEVEQARGMVLKAAEQILYQKVLEGHLPSIKYWLNNNFPDMYQDRKQQVVDLTSENGELGVVAPSVDDWADVLRRLEMVQTDSAPGQVEA